MDFLLLLIGAGFVAYLAFVWHSTESTAIRFWAVWAVVGCLILGIDVVLNTLCGIAENRSESFYERCEGSVPYMPLYAVPPLLATPFLRRFVSGPWVLMVGTLLVVVAIVIPQRLFSV